MGPSARLAPLICSTVTHIPLPALEGPVLSEHTQASSSVLPGPLERTVSDKRSERREMKLLKLPLEGRHLLLSCEEREPRHVLL